MLVCDVCGKVIKDTEKIGDIGFISSPKDSVDKNCVPLGADICEQCMEEIKREMRNKVRAGRKASLPYFPEE